MKKILYILPICFFLNLTIVKAQIPTIQWQKNYGGSSNDVAYSIQQTTDGGFIVAGSTKSIDSEVTGAHGNDDFWVIKINSLGVLVWEKSLGGSWDDDAYCVKQTSDGGYIVAGSSLSGDGAPDGDVTGGHGGYHYWIVKLSASGLIQWQKSYGGYNYIDGYDYAYSIQQTTDGGYIIAGQAGAGPGSTGSGEVSGNHGGLDFWVVKIDDTGALQWEKCYGGTTDESAREIQQTPDGGYIVAGYATSNDSEVSGNHGGYDCWVIKLSSSGGIEWQRCYGGSGDEGVNSIQRTIDGGYIMTANTSSTDGDVTGLHGGEDYWVVKIDSIGNIKWEKSYGGSQNDIPGTVLQTIDGGFIVSGSSMSNDGDVTANHGIFDYWIIKLSDTGAIQWQKSIGGSNYDQANCIRQTTDGGYIVAGNSSSIDGDATSNFGGNDFWVVKLSPSTTGVKELNQHSEFIGIHPNPVYDEFIVNFKTITNELTKIVITDQTGRIVSAKFWDGKSLTYEIDISQFNPGVYNVNISSISIGDKSIKIIKR